jgi:hypothetical protein
LKAALKDSTRGVTRMNTGDVLRRARGTYEVHFTEARPLGNDCAGRHDCGEPDHGPNCAVQVFPIDAPIRRMLVLESPWAPLT